MKNEQGRFSLISLCTFCLILGGCTSAPLTSELTSNTTQVAYDNFKKQTNYNGPGVSLSHPASGGNDYTGSYRLRVIKKDGILSKAQLYLVYRSSEWALFTSATADKEGTIDFTGFDREIGRGANILVIETVGANFPMEWLRKQADTGFTVRFYGERKNCDVTVTPAYIQGFLKAVGE